MKHTAKPSYLPFLAKPKSNAMSQVKNKKMKAQDNQNLTFLF